MDELAETYRGWIEGAVAKGDRRRDSRWTESVVVGSESFVKATGEKLGIKAKGRKVIGADGSYELRETRASYNTILAHENQDLRLQNAYIWNDSV